MVNAKSLAWTDLLTFVLHLLVLLKANGFPVNITFVKDAVAKGAVCLDGSPPAYHFSPGFGSGKNNWVVHMEGGGWCKDIKDCLARKNNHRGSSKEMKEVHFSAMLSNKEKFNPDFFNWNKVKVRSCDGSSFTGDIEKVDPETNLHFRGARVWLAVIEELLAKGLYKADNALLSGCSSGGLASILHCDNFRDILQPSARVKCLSDAGYFIHTKDISGQDHIKTYFDAIAATHGSANNLPNSCTSRYEPSLCFFPQYVVQHMRTPLFILNAAYDTWQIKNALAPETDDPHQFWSKCRHNILQCSTSQLQALQGFRSEFLSALPGYGNSLSPSTGMFISSCFAHCQGGTQATWLKAGSPVIDNTTIAKAVGDWFYDRSNIQKIDCPYPCNPSCHNLILGE